MRVIAEAASAIDILAAMVRVLPDKDNLGNNFRDSSVRSFTSKGRSAAIAERTAMAIKIRSLHCVPNEGMIQRLKQSEPRIAPMVFAGWAMLSEAHALLHTEASLRHDASEELKLDGEPARLAVARPTGPLP